jgi:hypothetical protein
MVNSKAFAELAYVAAGSAIAKAVLLRRELAI